MMSFEEFTEDVLKEIRLKMGDAFQIGKRDVVKNNDVKQTGIEVIKEEADIGPCVYLDELYREYKADGMKFGEVVDEVYRMILKCEGGRAGFRYIRIPGMGNYPWGYLSETC